MVPPVRLRIHNRHYTITQLGNIAQTKHTVHIW